jgi:dolichol-phosphate mannosyltransferase
MSPQLPFSIVMAARDEELTIADILHELRGLSDDIIVVDGRSKDGTAALARAAGARVIQDSGRGKGEAVRIGIGAARYPILLFIDADGSHDVGDIPKLVGPIQRGEADLVIGSRMKGGSDELFGSLSEVIRAFGSMIISLTINYRFGVRITDYQNGFRAIRTDVARDIGLTSDITTIEQEMAIKCLRHGYHVTECAAHEYRRRAGVSKIHVLKFAPLYVWNLIWGVAQPSVARKPMATQTPEVDAWKTAKESERV